MRVTMGISSKSRLPLAMANDYSLITEQFEGICIRYVFDCL